MGVTLKLATSLDGRIATAAGESRWITGEAARAQGHRLRAEHDAVVIGAETALADDPELSVRLGGYEGPQPARVVFDNNQRLPAGSRLAAGARAAPTWIVSSRPLAADLAAAGVRAVQPTADGTGRPEIGASIAALAEQGLGRLFLEGGGRLAASFLRAGAVDRIEWFRAPIILGEEGRPCIGALALGALSDALRFRRLSVEALGDDLWERYEKL